MLNAIVWMQWKHTRAMALLTTLLAFALPIASLQAARGMDTAQGFVIRMQVWGGAYALVAALAGLLVAVSAWRPDHTGRHVYALSLPISRSSYVWYRFVSGAAFLLKGIPKDKHKLIDPGLVEMALDCLRTGRVGDGKVFVTSLEEVVRVRTGERGEAAL